MQRFYIIIEHEHADQSWNVLGYVDANDTIDAQYQAGPWLVEKMTEGGCIRAERRCIVRITSALPSDYVAFEKEIKSIFPEIPKDSYLGQLEEELRVFLEEEKRKGNFPTVTL